VARKKKPLLRLPRLLLPPPLPLLTLLLPLLPRLTLQLPLPLRLTLPLRLLPRLLPPSNSGVATKKAGLVPAFFISVLPQ
jgi:hypothetical protein